MNILKILKVILIIGLISAVVCSCAEHSELNKRLIERNEKARQEAAINTETDFYPKETPDVDLTTLSSTMVYGEVFNMLQNPYNYLGKTIRINGIAASFADETTSQIYHSCIVMDATACCAQGIEYELSEGEYPKNDEEITVTGVYDLFEEDGVLYCILRNCVLAE